MLQRYDMDKYVSGVRLPSPRQLDASPQAPRDEARPSLDRCALALPSSGIVLAAIVDAFDLHALDAGGVLSTEHAQRHLRGKRGRTDTERRVLAAVSGALVAGGVVPPELAQASSAARGGSGHATAAETVHVLLSPALARWDEIAAQVGGIAVPSVSVRRAQAAVARLVVIDLAARVAAGRWLLHRERARSLCETWGRAEGTQEWLRAAVDRAGLTPLSLSRALGVAPARIEALLAGAARPTETEIHGLANAIGARDATSARASIGELRGRYAMSVFRSALATALGGALADEMIGRFLSYTNSLLALVQRPGGAPARRERRTRAMLFQGTEHAKGTDSLWLLSLLRILWKAEPELQWRNSLRAATGSWPAHLAFAFVGPTPAEGRAPEPPESTRRMGAARRSS